ncbi:MAG: protein-export chaperone SecB [Flavobacterium sp.]|nr:protein-export chaperone SecB [Pedobacter sp.]
MEQKPKGGFKFQEFFITDFSISRKPIKQGDKDLEIDYHPNAVLGLKTKTYVLGLKIELKDPDGSFTMTIDSLGFFAFDDIDSLEELKPILYLNAPAILFPYIRSFVASVTALSGLEAVHIPVTNLSFLRKAVEENTVVTEEDEDEFE